MSKLLAWIVKIGKTSGSYVIVDMFRKVWAKVKVHTIITEPIIHIKFLRGGEDSFKNTTSSPIEKQLKTDGQIKV